MMRRVKLPEAIPYKLPEALVSTPKTLFPSHHRPSGTVRRIAKSAACQASTHSPEETQS